MEQQNPTIAELDVRVFVPMQRHETLLKMFKELPVGESFIFINDHDPLPLFYEFKSIHGDVVGWAYLSKGGREWKVKVTRTEASQGREFTDISTLMDLRKIEKSDWKHVVFHRYGMMKKDHVMEIISAELPEEIKSIFESKFADECSWVLKREIPGEYVVHVIKNTDKEEFVEKEIVLRKVFDVRPFPPAQRHDMVFQSFDELNAGEAFEFTNDHDPKPLYYQIEAESKIPFKWEYLIDGPEVWTIRVSKLR